MERNRKIKTLSLVALIVAVLGLGVAFAALSSKLTINGSATVDAATWSVRFATSDDDLGTLKHPDFDMNGDGTVGENVTITKTSITNVSLGVTKPNDFAMIHDYLMNDGTIDAKLVSYELPTLCTTSSPVESCDWDNDGTVSKSDVDKVNENISIIGYCARYVGSSSMYKVGDVMEASSLGKCTFGIAYAKIKNLESFANGDESSFEESTELPSRSLKFSNLSFKVNFEQAD